MQIASTVVTSNTKPHLVQPLRWQRGKRPEGYCVNCGATGELGVLLDLAPNAVGCAPVPDFRSGRPSWT